MMKIIRAAAVAAALALVWSPPARAQVTTPGLPIVPLGYCQLTATQLGSAIGLASCTRASFTASAGSQSNLLVATAVSGVILTGDTLLTGTGVTAGSTVLNQVSGTPGGAGTYTVSAPNTTSSASVTSGGIPPLATAAYVQAETAGVRYRDDGGAPTATVGSIIVSGTGIYYPGALASIQFIAQTGSPLLDVTFYRAFP